MTKTELMSTMNNPAHSILYIEASPRKERSASIEVANALIASLKRRYTRAQVQTLDVWDITLPEVTGHVLEAKYAGLAGVELSGEQAQAWAIVEGIAAQFKAADTLVFAIPLWNFGIPYKLKHLIDVVTQKDVLFGFDETGFNGMLRNQQACVVYARGLNFSPTSDTPAGSYDFQKPYIDMWLRFIGIRDIHTLIVEKTIFDAETDKAARAAAISEVDKLVAAL